jgi:hypothetical protein
MPVLELAGDRGASFSKVRLTIHFDTSLSPHPSLLSFRKKEQAEFVARFVINFSESTPE